MFIRKKGGSNNELGLVYIYSQTADVYEGLRDSLKLYNIVSQCLYLNHSDIENKALRNDDGKTIYIIDEDSYDVNSIRYLARTLKKKKKILLGKSNSLNALWRAKQIGFDEYFSLNSEVDILVTIILNMLGNFKKNKCLILSALNTSLNSDLSYRLLDDIINSERLENRKSLVINYDFFNIYYDYKFNIKPDDQAKEYFLNGDFGTLDYLSANKMIDKIKDKLDYFSLNLLSCKGKDISDVLDKFDKFINIMSENYDIIIITCPVYISAKEQGVKMISQSDIVAFMTNGTVESIYNLKRLSEKIPVYREGNLKTLNINVSNERYNYEHKLNDEEIEEAFGINNIINLGCVTKSLLKRNKNIIDYILNPKR